MHSRRIYIAAAAAVSAFGLAATAASAQNVLINPGFESAPSGNPNDWQYFNGAAQDNTNPHSGSFEANLNNITPAQNTYVFQQTAVGTITPGVQYTLNFYSQFQGVNGGVAQLQFEFQNSTGGILPGSPSFSNIPTTTSGFGTPAGYVLDTFMFTAPAGASVAYVGFNAVTGANTGDTSHVYIDDVSLTPPVVSGPPQWNVNSSGDWNVGSNWTGNVAPNASGAEADFFAASTSNHTVYADAPVVAGTLNFNDATPYVIAGSSTLTMQTSSGNANIIVQAGNDSITLPLTLASNTTINVSGGASLNIANSLTVNTGISVTQTGAGSVVYSNIVTLLPGATVSFGNDTANSLNIGSSAVASVSGTGSVLNVYNLNITSGGKLDVAKGTVNVNYGGGNPNGGGPDPIATIRTQLASAYAAGAWTGSGITTSSGDSHHGVGYADNGSTVELKYTLYGDTNLDGTVNFTDLLSLAQHYNSTNATWSTGDFNYDGTVNFADLLALAQNYNGVLGPNASGLSPSFVADWNLAQSEVAAVPEPASLGLLALGALSLVHRHRREV